MLDLEVSQVGLDSIRRQTRHLWIGGGLVVVAEEHGREPGPRFEGPDDPPPRRVERFRRQKRQTEAGVDHVARRDRDGGQVLDVYLEAGPQVRLDGLLQGGSGGGLAIDCQDSPTRSKELARIASGAAAEIHCVAGGDGA